MSNLYTSIKNLLLTICPMYSILDEYPREVYINLGSDPINEYRYCMLRIRDYPKHSIIELHNSDYVLHKEYLTLFIQTLKELYEVREHISDTRVAWYVEDRK